MTKPKTIAFRPSHIDQSLIDALFESGQFKDTSSVMRAAIQQLALVSLESEKYVSTIAQAYEDDVMPL